MTHCWKTEYAVVDKGGDVLAYMETIEGAIEYAVIRKAEKIQRIRHWNTEYEDIWYTDWEKEQ